MKEFYKNLLKVYMFMSRALFPKDSALQREFLLIRHLFWIKTSKRKNPKIPQRIMPLAIKISGVNIGVWLT